MPYPIILFAWSLRYPFNPRGGSPLYRLDIRSSWRTTLWTQFHHLVAVFTWKWRHTTSLWKKEIRQWRNFISQKFSPNYFKSLDWQKFQDCFWQILKNPLIKLACLRFNILIRQIIKIAKMKYNFRSVFAPYFHYEVNWYVQNFKKISVNVSLPFLIFPYILIELPYWSPMWDVRVWRNFPLRFSVRGKHWGPCSHKIIPESHTGRGGKTLSLLVCSTSSFPWYVFL